MQMSLVTMFSAIWLAGCVSTDPGRLRVIVRGESGEEISRVLVTAGEHATTSRPHVGAEFEKLKPGKYLVDAQVPGMRSCGPIPARVRGGKKAVVVLLMRMGAIYDYVQLIGPTAPPDDEQLVAETWFRPCPGRPGTARVIRMFASGRTQESPGPYPE
jgi:hypothetical protein